MRTMRWLTSKAGGMGGTFFQKVGSSRYATLERMLRRAGARRKPWSIGGLSRYNPQRWS
jgi:hypothetical protein